jgi:hypothetical protein
MMKLRLMYLACAALAFLPAACAEDPSKVNAGLANFQANADKVAKVAGVVCQVYTQDGPAFVALAEINGAPVAATTAAKAIVDADCAAIGAIAAPAGAVPTSTVTLPKPPS